MNTFLSARLAANLSQGQASKKSGVAKDTISRIERGLMNPSLINAAKLADAYGVTLDELAGRTANAA